LRRQNALADLEGQSKIAGLSDIFIYLVNESHENIGFSGKSIISGFPARKNRAFQL